MRRGVWCAVLLLVCAARAAGQQREPVGPFVVDVRGLSAGLPTTEGWTPVVPVDTIVPSRAFGLEAGAHAYPLQWGGVRIGVGAAFTLARGTTTSTVAGTPDVVTRSSTIAPQMSFNFGHRLGWSHLSLGYGGAKVVSEASAIGQTPATTADGGWSGALNFGGGARWFITDHLGVGFDVRWHRVSGRAATDTNPAAPRATLFHLAVGVSVQ